MASYVHTQYNLVAINCATQQPTNNNNCQQQQLLSTATKSAILYSILLNHCLALSVQVHAPDHLQHRRYSFWTLWHPSRKVLLYRLLAVPYYGSVRIGTTTTLNVSDFCHRCAVVQSAAQSNIMHDGSISVSGCCMASVTRSS